MVIENATTHMNGEKTDFISDQGSKGRNLKKPLQNAFLESIYLKGEGLIVLKDLIRMLVKMHLEKKSENLPCSGS